MCRSRFTVGEDARMSVDRTSCVTSKRGCFAFIPKYRTRGDLVGTGHREFAFAYQELSLSFLLLAIPPMSSLLASPRSSLLSLSSTRILAGLSTRLSFPFRHPSPRANLVISARQKFLSKLEEKQSKTHRIRIPEIAAGE